MTMYRVIVGLNVAGAVANGTTFLLYPNLLSIAVAILNVCVLVFVIETESRMRARKRR